MTSKVIRKIFTGETAPLVDLCLAIVDCPHSTPRWTNEGKLVIRNFNVKNGKLDLSEKFYTDKDTFNNRIKRIKPASGDLIITREAPMGEVCIIPDDIECCLGQRMVLIRPNKTLINNNYLLYSILSEYVQIQIKKSDTSGSIVSNLCIPDLEELRIPITTSENQDNIAAILSALDSKIEINNRINVELEAMAKALYDYWFVQFDFPDQNGNPYKSSGGKMEWNNQRKGEIPQGWEVKRLGNAVETSLGGTPSTENRSYWENGTVNWLNSGEVANFPVINSELKITEAAVHNSATNLLPKGTVLLSITRHLRPTVLAIDACANQSVVGIKEKGDLKYYFIYPYLKNEIPRLITLRTGAQQPHINKDIVDASLITIPSEESNILRLYNSKIGSAYEQVMNNAFQNQQLAELRDWLLPMLMNGQVKVRRGTHENEPAKAPDQNEWLAGALL